MDASSLFTSILALAFVLGLIGLVHIGLKRFGPEKMFYALQKKKGAGKRLSIEETLVLDARRRVVSIKWDKTEYLVLLGATSEQVIAKNAAKKTNA